MKTNLIVKKFGGTSLATTQRIDFIAGKIASEKKESERVVVIVSAMGNHTDELIKLALEINPVPCQRELDMLLTAGERISMSLLSIALQKYGIDAI
ncbi:MAG: aspartate kinase, partial [Candidatus Cloacimonetes bacterium]|nr:aspartate kinase [Candidatus Cloacimonadota bacterium]